LVLVRKQPGLKAGAFSPALLVPVVTTGTNGRYNPGPMTFFPPVDLMGFSMRTNQWHHFQQSKKELNVHVVWSITMWIFLNASSRTAKFIN
jgi:hypothetical protein